MESGIRFPLINHLRMDTFNPKCDVEHCEIGTEGTSREEQDNSSFTLADYNALLPLYTTADLESDEAQELLMNYISYLHEVVEKFEQGPLGLKANLDENKYLIVLTGDDKERFLFLAFEGNTRPFTDDEQDELLMIYECITASLHIMAISARERGLDCWILPGPEETQLELNLSFPNIRTGCYKRNILLRKGRN